jgi:hypothetical protein
VRLDERKSAGSGITKRAIRRSDRHRGWFRSNFVARERQEADHRPITPSIWGMSAELALTDKSFQMPRSERREMTHVLIATPTVGGVVKSLYATTLVKVILAVKDANWNIDFVTVDGGYVSTARNYFANLLLGQSHFTHLVMIDSDMSFESHVICRLVRCGKPVVAAAYSQRRMDMEAFAQASRNPELTPADRAALALTYNLQPEPEPGTRQVKVTDGMCRVNRIALGCAVIQRSALESLIAAGMVQSLPDHSSERIGLRGPFYDFFSEITPEDGNRLSEDYSFCKRWRSMPGNEIWAVVDEPIGHVGDMIYSAPYLNRLLQGKVIKRTRLTD